MSTKPFRLIRVLFAAYFATLLVLLPTFPATATEAFDTFELVPLQGPARQFSRAALEALPQASVLQKDPKGIEHVYTGPTLRTLLTSLGLPEGEPLRDRYLKIAVLIEARDGYKVVFSIVELDPSFTKRVTIVATRVDGKEMNAQEGPLRIAVQDEMRPARWVRQSARLRVVTID